MDVGGGGVKMSKLERQARPNFETFTRLNRPRPTYTAPPPPPPSSTGGHPPYCSHKKNIKGERGVSTET